MSNDLQNRLYNFEVSPPPGTWNKIVTELDESHLSNQFPTSLYNLEVDPPGAAWNKVKASLSDDEVSPARIRRIAPVWRYAAAAAVIAAVVFGSTRFFAGTSEDNPLVTQTSDPSTKQAPVTTPPVENPVTVPTITSDPIDEARNDAALEASKHTYASLDASERQNIKRVSEEHFLSLADPISAAGDINPGNTYRDAKCTYINAPSFAFNDDHSPIDMANRYVMMMTPEGHFVRISKKLGPLVCCVSGEEEDEDCNNQLKKWREKIANPSVSATSGNFLELLNLIHTFKE